MNRREFTGLLAAGVVFPVDIVKALGSSPKHEQRGTHWWCLGTDEEPAYEYELAHVQECVNSGKWSHPPWTPKLQDIPCVGYEITIPSERWVIVLGNEDRPAFDEDIKEFSDSLFGYLKTNRHKSTIVTHFTAVPYEFMGCTLHDPPMVISHKMAKGWLKHGKIRKISPKWSNFAVDMRRSQTIVTKPKIFSDRWWLDHPW